jgi:hypothetical protein
MQRALPWNDATPLDAKEANALRDNLIEGVTAFWQGCDNVITYTNRKHTEAYIWQTIDEEDTAFLVDAILNIATKNKVVAAAVRGIARTSRMLRAGAIMMPRFMQTVQFYADNGGFYLGGMAA